ncbi:hypothetical protein TCAL_13867, partial [Tigriopus californicus]|eukprot:TCALIF_13867-PA protein Name:"Protein of unknown function" AED:0.31 eAED:0.60 QI:43/0/0.33/0.66/0.5/0/3/0/161
MLNAIFIALLLLLRGQAAHINGFVVFAPIKVAHKQVWEQDGSGMDIKEWPPFDDPSKTCDGTADETIEITFTDTTGCFQFQTPGFNAGGYPNSTNVTPGRNSYGCQFNNQFGNNNVTGTVTVFKEGFEFEKDDNGACVDLFVFGFVDDVSDQEDFSTMAGM